MNTNDRRRKILDILEKEKSVTVDHLSKILNISEVTIRRDLKLLEYENMLSRTFGGATIEHMLTHDKSFYARLKEKSEEKNKIAKYVCSLIKSGQSIAISSGTTSLLIARNMPFDVGITVVTDDIYIALELCKRPNIEVILLGGWVRKNSYAITGNFAEEMLNEMRFDFAFITAAGVIPGEGFFDGVSNHSQIKKLMMSASKEKYFIVDSSKFGKVKFFKFCNFDNSIKIITDSSLEKKYLDQVKKYKVEIILV
jgi:DeoR family transcriptional regulator of aga operon